MVVLFATGIPQAAWALHVYINSAKVVIDSVSE